MGAGLLGAVCRTPATLNRTHSYLLRGQPKLAWDSGGPETGRVIDALAYLKVSNPLVAWLVYRGEMVSGGVLDASAFSIWHTERLRLAGTTLAPYLTELAIEAARAERFQDRSSRLKGFYVFPDERSARRASDSWDSEGFRPEFLAEVGIREGSRISAYDSDWISGHFQEGPGPWVEEYLAGNPQSLDPLWEWVVEGRGYVYGTELRERAREVVKSTWPETMSLLELSRLGVELGSDLGMITAIVRNDGENTSVDYAMNFVDARRQEFLSRLGLYIKEHPDLVDHAALAGFSGDSFRVPDLRGRGFVVRLVAPGSAPS